MVTRETCPQCKGNKVVYIERPTGASEWRQCPACNGTGFKVRIVHGGCASPHTVTRPF
jgi:DnaJ-class molecular chaperone